MTERREKCGRGGCGTAEKKEKKTPAKRLYVRVLFLFYSVVVIDDNKNIIQVRFFSSEI